MIEADYRCVDCDRPLTEEEEDEGICEQCAARRDYHERMDKTEDEP